MFEKVFNIFSNVEILKLALINYLQHRNENSANYYNTKLHLCNEFGSSSNPNTVKLKSFMSEKKLLSLFGTALSSSSSSNQYRRNKLHSCKRHGENMLKMQCLCNFINILS